MVFLISPGHLLPFMVIFSHYTCSVPVLDSEEDVRGFTGVSRSMMNQLGNPLIRDYMDDFLEEKQSMPRESGLQTRQLGDIEFSNKYGEFLRAKAKLTTICSLLRRMQSVKKSGISGDSERVNELWRQYSCPTVYQLTSEL